MLTLKLVTPERVLFQEEASSVTLPTSEGEITVLPKHEDLVAVLKPGVAKLVRPDGTIEDVAVSGGFIQIANNLVTVLADTAERGEELTIDAIKQAQERAAELMKQTKFADDTSYASAAAAMERELARYRTAVRHHARRGLPIAERANIPKDENPV
jgi:F-type H+-transporting ATPase subunit epsilon